MYIVRKQIISLESPLIASELNKLIPSFDVKLEKELGREVI